MTASAADRPRREGRRRRSAPDRARRLAFDALRAVNADGAYANLVLGQLLTARRLDPRDAAFATELLAGTCRRQGSYDLIIAAASGRAVTSLQPAVLDLLRLGSHQLLGMRVPAHAAVATSVDLAAATVGPRVAGLVNAVLRKVAAQDWDGWIDALAAGADRLTALGLRHAHPRWIVEAFADVLPPEELEPALAANNQGPAVSLVVRPGLALVEELLDAGAGPGRWSPWAATWTQNPAEVPAVAAGRAGVQDEGSQLVAWGLTRPPAPPGHWLDLCAGPGGKSALLRGLADAQGSRLVSAELSRHRAGLVVAALRGYPGRAAVVVADGTRPAWPPGAFTRVLADVPCTGLGALRRRPESRWRHRVEDLDTLLPLQAALLDTALDSAAAGGVVAYVTCSPHRAETAGVVAAVRSRRSDTGLIPAADVLPELPAGAFAGDFLQLWPHRHGTDAMFAAYLRKARS